MNELVVLGFGAAFAVYATWEGRRLDRAKDEKTRRAFEGCTREAEWIRSKPGSHESKPSSPR